MLTSIPFLLIANIAMLAAYIPLNRRRAAHYLEFPVDRYIPRLSIFVVPYAVYWFFVPFASYIIMQSVERQRFLEAMLLGSSLCVIFWAFFPTGVRRPVIGQTGILNRFLRTIYVHDGDSNAMPSGHVTLTTIIAYFLAVTNPQLAVPIWILAVFIDISTVFTKQHYVIDVVIGLLVAWIAIIW